ncbi:MAG: 2-oxo acid dehydrogenase subunit E2 [Actinobacteria bacterium]|nr:2-oxo acid dehydrogenase subunit E2 [Actinomycetota bacterium]
MAVAVVMPRLSDSMEEGVVVVWHKAVGDSVRSGEPLVDVETDKATMTYESELDGTVLELLAGEGETVPLGAPIARIGDPGEAASEGIAAPSVAPPPPRRRNGRVLASPLARRLAAEVGLDLAPLAGSGPRGRIVKADVEAALAAPAATPAIAGAKGANEAVELTRLQGTVARRMAESKATVPHFYLETEVEMTAAVAARDALKAAAAPDEAIPSLNDIVVRACALALHDHPKANASYRGETFELHSRVNVGIAVAAPGALLVPTIFDADRKGLTEIAAETRALSAKARGGTITAPELGGGTFSVSNLGMLGIDSFAPIVNPPQAAILGVGAIAERPLVRDGELAVGTLMRVTLSCDHRVLYGAEGAEFLATVRRLLEQPLRLAG